MITRFCQGPVLMSLVFVMSCIADSAGPYSWQTPQVA